MHTHTHTLTEVLLVHGASQSVVPGEQTFPEEQSFLPEEQSFHPEGAPDLV
jgi:hypothetical protein